MLIPEDWKTKRQKIIEVYTLTKSVPDTAEEIYGRRNVSYVRTVVTKWRNFVREQELSTGVDKVGK